jgi:AraC-like DNA-binding protein
LTRDFRVELTDELEFGPPACLDLARLKTLSRMIEIVICDLTDRESLIVEHPVGMQIERTLLLLLLRSVPHSYSALMSGSKFPVAPYYVRRAERYVNEKIGDQITMQDLAAAAGVSMRTLFNGFRTYRKVTPMRFVKNVRLIRAREMLLDARSGASRITSIAGAVGYGNLSQFSRDYKKRFCESPLETARRS